MEPDVVKLCNQQGTKGLIQNPLCFSFRQIYNERRQKYLKTKLSLSPKKTNFKNIISMYNILLLLMYFLLVFQFYTFYCCYSNFTLHTLPLKLVLAYIR